jgi:hypothetical protein
MNENSPRSPGPAVVTPGQVVTVSVICALASAVVVVIAALLRSWSHDDAPSSALEVKGGGGNPAPAATSATLRGA